MNADNHSQANGLIFSLDIDLNIYSIDAIKNAAYKFTDRCSIYLEELNQEAHSVKAVFRFLDNKTKSDQDRILNEFKNELLDQDLRERISSETEAVRNLILAQAFSKTSLLDE